MFLPHVKTQKYSDSNIYAIRIMLATKYAKIFSKQKYTLSTAKKSIKVAYIICLKQRIGKHVGGIFL